MPEFGVSIQANFNPRPPQGERHRLKALTNTPPEISIHAPRKGSDGDRVSERFLNIISIHAPRKGSDILTRVKIKYR